MTDKKSIRAHILSLRDKLSSDWRRNASLKIAEFIDYNGLNLSHATIAGYMPLGSEADPRPAMYNLAQRGSRLCLPHTHNSHLSYHEYGFGDVLVKSGFNTEAPDLKTPTVCPDVLLVPLVAFDLTGARLGWGKGYYDRSISMLRADGYPVLTIGIAFSFQQVNVIPEEPHDVALDCVATETDFIKCARAL